MDNTFRYLSQALLYAVFFVPLVYISHLPIHRHLADDMAVLKIAVRHPGQIIGECRSVTGSGGGMRPDAM